ncbi:MAG: hypothetical protein R3Y16_07215 [Rikenellaceae bacterium]
MKFRKDPKIKLRRECYVSFKPLQLREAAANDPQNREAFEMLYHSMFTSRKVPDSEVKAGTDSVKYLYPVSKEQSEQMSRDLDLAYDLAGNPNDELFASRYNELREIAKWSLERQDITQILPMLSIGLIILTNFYIGITGIFNIGTVSMKDSVEEWVEQKSTYPYAKLDRIKAGEFRFSNANKYTRSVLTALKDSAEISKLRATEALATSEKRAAKFEEAAAAYVEEYNKINEMSYKELRERAMDDAKESDWSSKKSAFGSLIFSIICVFILRLYIYSQQSYGYTITRYRFENKLIDRFERFVFWVTLGSLKLASKLRPVKDNSTTTVYKSASGGVVRTETNVDGFAAAINLLILFFQMTLFMFAYLFILFISPLALFILTLHGLHRNYGFRVLFGRLFSSESKDKEEVREGVSSLEAEPQSSPSVSFTPLQMRAEAAKNPENEEAFEMLYQAMLSTDKISDGEKRAGVNSVEYLYPETKEQSEQMNEDLDLAYDLAGDPDNEPFATYYKALRDIADKSLEKYKE